MELKQIKELMTAMERAGIKKLSVKENGGFELHLERQEELPHLSSSVAPPHSHHFLAREGEIHLREHVQHLPKTVAQIEAPLEKKEEKVEGKFIVSPMVGTFYASPAPEDPAFVKVGDRVDENTVVCIIEAMKVMNEVKAGVSGTVAEIYVQNAHPVEFGTKIFRIV